MNQPSPRSAAVVSLALLLGACAQTTVRMTEPKVEVTDQAVQNGQVTIGSVTARESGFIVLHEAAPGGGPQVPQSIGHAYVQAGVNTNVKITLTKSVTTNDKLWAMLHVDSNNNGAYEFGPGSTDVDTPVKKDGQVVVVPFTVTGRQGTVQAPALPGAQPISGRDRVYTADQSSNTVTVINPATNEVLGTIPVGEARLDGALGPVDRNQVNAHGLGFARDGSRLDVIDVTSNAAQVVDPATNKITQTIYTGRSPHEGFISPDGRELWVAVRGEDYVAVLDLGTGREVERIKTAEGPSKVVFNPTGELAFVNHLFAQNVAVINVRTRQVIQTIPLPPAVGGSADEAISPDGDELWLGHPNSGKTTVINAKKFTVEAVLGTGPRTNHPNFITTREGEFAWVTVGGLNQTQVYRRSEDGSPPTLTDTIHNSGVAPHGLWPSPDNTRMYIALQKSDAVDVVDVATRNIIQTLRVGQDPQALVYVSNAVPEGSDGKTNLSRQGLGKRVENLKIEVRGVAGDASGNANIREVKDLEEVDIAVRGLPPRQDFTAYASDGQHTAAIVDVTSDEQGVVPEALAFFKFFDNYDRVILMPKGQRP